MLEKNTKLCYIFDTINTFIDEISNNCLIILMYKEKAKFFF